MEDGADGRSLATVMGTKQKVQLPGISSLAFLSPLVHFSAYFSGFFFFFLSWKWDPRGAGLVEEGRRAVVAGSIAVKAGRVSVCKGRAGFGKGRVFKKQKG